MGSVFNHDEDGLKGADLKYHVGVGQRADFLNETIDQLAQLTVGEKDGHKSGESKGHGGDKQRRESTNCDQSYVPYLVHPNQVQFSSPILPQNFHGAMGLQNHNPNISLLNGSVNMNQTNVQIPQPHVFYIPMPYSSPHHQHGGPDGTFWTVPPPQPQIPRSTVRIRLRAPLPQQQFAMLPGIPGRHSEPAVIRHPDYLLKPYQTHHSNPQYNQFHTVVPSPSYYAQNQLYRIASNSPQPRLIHHPPAVVPRFIRYPPFPLELHAQPLRDPSPNLPSPVPVPISNSAKTTNSANIADEYLLADKRRSPNGTELTESRGSLSPVSSVTPPSESGADFENIPIHDPTFSEYFYALQRKRNGADCDATLTSAFCALPLHKQLDHFLSGLAMSVEAQNMRKKLLSDLLSFLIRRFPRCHIYPFGSLVTGLGDDKSDIDVYVDACNISQMNNGLLPDPNRPSSLEVLEVCCETLLDCKPKKRFYRLDSIEAIRETRIPIIKFTHLNGVSCDLSFENMISVKNSEMISFYIKLHPVVRPLLVLVRYWAKFHRLTGSSMIKNYCLVLLVLTFLSMRKVVPPVNVLQDVKMQQRKIRGVNDYKHVVDGWDTDFPEPEERMIDSVHTAFPSSLPVESLKEEDEFVSTVFQLLEDFFQFFAMTPLDTEVVSPYEGGLLPRIHFSVQKEHLLPPSFFRYKIGLYCNNTGEVRPRLNGRTALVVQDPFVLNFNVGGVTSAFVLKKFQKASGFTAELISQNRKMENKSLVNIFVPLKD